MDARFAGRRPQEGQEAADRRRPGPIASEQQLREAQGAGRDEQGDHLTGEQHT
ncbi:hypothetical protein [Streptomyces cyaneofuscatus]|uniref:hypothetical protein n=1 Tax=Streptomyces TaxID=1883 RepID=UPI002E10006C|nr:hypothetical protein OG366_03905 [Streptomyces cyaneofuscatus]WTF39256.1 hypothetical protein OG973_32675 [Streptomyces cyaneofuscatus]